jgi:peroxiredoxin
MKQKINENLQAPDFELTDTRGEIIRLNAYRGKSVLLVLLRGFV